MVSQDVILFDDSIKNNISYAKSNASEEEILKACKFAAADEFIEKHYTNDDLEYICEKNCSNLKQESLENGNNNDLNGSHTVIWLLKKFDSFYGTSLLLILQFTEIFFIYSLDMCQPLILINILKWSVFDYNLLVFGSGVMVIMPCFAFICLKVSDRTIFYFSVFGVFSYCILQAIQIIWTKQLLSSTGNMLISVMYVPFWSQCSIHAQCMQEWYLPTTNLLLMVFG